MINDVYMVKEPGMDGSWYNVVKVVDRHMEIVPHVYTYEDAECLVTKLSNKLSVA